MKKTLILFVFTILGICVNAQKLYKVSNIQGGVYNKYQKKWDWGKTEEVDLTITLFGNNIYVNDEAQTHITTYEDLGEKISYDDDGDKYRMHTWRAVDEKQRRCLFTMVFYMTIDLEVYTVIYSDFGFRYYISNKGLDKFKSKP